MKIVKKQKNKGGGKKRANRRELCREYIIFSLF